jgi:hypothetical protein
MTHLAIAVSIAIVAAALQVLPVQRGGAAIAAEATPNFSGTWVLNAAKSQNLGMMAALKDTLTISHTTRELVVRHRTSYQGQESAREVRYDLTGKTVSNEGPMGDRNETIARWVEGKIVTTWTREGAVAGTKSVMTETRSLAADGKTMSVASVRGANAPVVMVYDKQ